MRAACSAALDAARRDMRRIAAGSLSRFNFVREDHRKLAGLRGQVQRSWFQFPRFRVHWHFGFKDRAQPVPEGRFNAASSCRTFA